MSSRLVAAKPPWAKARVAAARSCSRRSARRNRRTRVGAAALAAGWLAGGRLVGMPHPDARFVDTRVYNTYRLLQSKQSEVQPEDAPMDDAIVEVEGLVKVFKGEVRALDGLSLTVPPGSVYGLLGPNGAGKTTLIRVLATLLQPDGGTARVAGVDVRADPARVRARIGLDGPSVARGGGPGGRPRARVPPPPARWARRLGRPRPVPRRRRGPHRPRECRDGRAA